MTTKAKGCPKCPHCQAEALRAIGEAPVASGLAAATRRPWQQPHYGEKITSIVDWFDGNWIGSYAKSKAEAIAPAQIKDPQSWLEGFAEGWEDAERYREIARSWNREKESQACNSTGRIGPVTKSDAGAPVSAGPRREAKPLGGPAQ